MILSWPPSSKLELCDLLVLRISRESGPLMARSMEKRLPHAKSPRNRNELMLIPRVELMFLALDQFRINSGGLRCELRIRGTADKMAALK